MRGWNARNSERINRERRARYADDPAPKRHRGRIAHLQKRPGFDAETDSFVQTLVRDPCAYCGATTIPLGTGRQTPLSSAVDHIDASGDSHWTNLTNSCVSCNAVKGTTSLLLSLLERQLRQDLTPIAEQLWVLKGRTGSRRRIDF